MQYTIKSTVIPLIIICTLLVCFSWTILNNNKQDAVPSFQTFRSTAQFKYEASYGMDIPIIYAITVTYTRAVQLAEMTNMCTLLRHIRYITWLVVEDAEKPSAHMKKFLERCPVKSVHMYVKSKQSPELTVPQRNMALKWIRDNVGVTQHGVVYFADDDNTYDPRIFEEMRYTSLISVFPVGLASGVEAETAIVKNGKVVDWMSGWFDNRKFPIDMAGFAVNIRLLHEFPNAGFSYNGTHGHAETEFLEAFNITQEQLEPLANDCTRLLVWHTQTVKVNLKKATVRNGSPVPVID